MTKKKNPSVLVAQVTLTATQRKSIGAGSYVPRERQDNEALPITFSESKLNAIPKMQSTRPGADDHTAIGRRGYFC